ncbi:MAG: helix-turn-helix domain-containing protein [Planctomycetes bacterium]|nr:helix-turn-helix domain-containing protein [Planctomycetota bacterium]MCB9910527.1 helix-turn-helix domain-containing protein [Planctomycetota bacterium]MCB9912653.1 helix-turn-helix domain-containing protein [Planctomycetota bacterium]
MKNPSMSRISAVPKDGEASREAWTVADVAAYFHRSPKTIHRWVESGILPPPRRIMGSKYWYRYEIEAVLNQRGKAQ